MSRLASLMLWLAVAACGQDTPGSDLDAPGSPDASGVTFPDALPTQALCDMATQHSDFAWIQRNVFVPMCASGCHTEPDPEVGLSLAAGQAYANLVNKGASTVSGWTRVVPGSVAQSYLVVALGRAPGPPPRDGFMPLGAPPLCVPLLEAVERWIEAGAPP